MPSRTSESIAARNAASVFPEPVGAATSAWRPALIVGQASTCAGVGAAKAEENHAPTAGWKSSRTFWVMVGTPIERLPHKEPHRPSDRTLAQRRPRPRRASFSAARIRCTHAEIVSRARDRSVYFLEMQLGHAHLSRQPALSARAQRCRPGPTRPGPQSHRDEQLRAARTTG